MGFRWSRAAKFNHVKGITMSKAQEIRQKRAAIIAAMQAITDRVDAEKRDFSTDEEREFNEREAEVKSLSKRLAMEETLAGHVSESSKRSEAVYEAADDVRAHAKAQSETSKDSKWGNMGEFLRAVVDAGSPGHRADPRLFEARAAGLSEGVNADGGFLVDKDFSQEILSKVYASAQLASRCRRVQISGPSNGLKINVIDETSRADGSRFGGVQAYWAAEASAATASKPKFRQLEIGLKKLMGLCYVTDELMSDTVAMSQMITQAFIEEMAFKLDDAILNGDGDGKPLGILEGAGLLSVAKEAGQAAGTITKENLVKMKARYHGQLDSAIWLVNQGVEPQLNLLTLGDLGQYFPGGTFANQPYDQLFGRPVVRCEQAAALGSVGDISLIDFSKYLLIEKGGIKGETSIHVRFLYDELAFRWTLRVGGAPMFDSVVTPFKGGNSLSPYVALAERA